MVDDSVLNKIKLLGRIAWGITISLCVLVWIIIGIYYLLKNAFVAAAVIIFLAVLLIYLIRFGWEIFNKNN